MNLFLKLLAANLGAIMFLIFTVWALNNNHPAYAVISFIVALCSVTTIESNNKL